jgi:hypothetical protein
MFLPFEVRLLTFLHSSTCNTLEDFVGCLFWTLGITGRIRFSTVGFSVIVDFSIFSAGLTLFIEVQKEKDNLPNKKITKNYLKILVWSNLFCRTIYKIY